MGVVEELAQARADYERGEWATALDGWSGTDPGSMGLDDLRAAALAAYLLGRPATSVEFWQRAVRACEQAGDPAAAVRCVFSLTMVLGTTGEPALAAAWTARAQQLLEELEATGATGPERGYVAFLHMFAHLQQSEWSAAAGCAEEAVAAGRDHGDTDLLALGLCAAGRVWIYAGRVPEGVRLLDEAMARVTAGETSPEVLGNVYCTAIEGCQEIADTERLVAWTAALHRWCATLPGLVAFTGQCSVHRAQVLRVRGAWPEALEELDRAVQRYLDAGQPTAVGLAEAERGDLLRLRGDLAAADAAYQRAAEHGFDPQPGLALLWLARGSTEAASGAVRRLLAEATGPVPRCRLLPAAVTVLLAVGAVDEARAAAREAEQLGHSIGTTAANSGAGLASGAVELAADDPAGALPYLRRARELWGRVGSPYDVARVRLLLGRAMAGLGDRASARAELEAAHAAFRDLGARPDAAEAERLLSPDELPGGLSPREAEVLRLVAAGRSNSAIAAELVLSEKTVARHLSNIFAKLDVPSRTAAAAYAFEHHLA